MRIVASRQPIVDGLVAVGFRVIGMVVLIGPRIEIEMVDVQHMRRRWVFHSSSVNTPPVNLGRFQVVRNW